jgi:hypothetical protein
VELLIIQVLLGYICINKSATIIYKMSNYSNNLIGQYNTLLGFNTDTSGNISNSTAIGYGARSEFSNSIVLGTINERIIIKGNISIGKSTIPISTLDISGNIITTRDININGLNIGRGNASIDTNTAIGTNALLTNTTGVQNTAIGNGVLETNTTGSLNSAIGFNALRNNNNSSNCAFGYNTLYVNNGNENSAFGYSSMYFNSSGTYNSAVGSSTLFNNTSGSNNCGIGYGSLYNNTSGTNNNAFGSSAGQSNITGSYNTFLGRGTDCSGGTGFNNSTALGVNAKITASNQIVLGTATESLYALGLPAFCCRAFGVFASTGVNNGNQTIFKSGNIASIVRTTFAGNYIITFITPMPTQYYCVSGSCSYQYGVYSDVQTTTNFVLIIGSGTDRPYNSFMVIC